MATQFGVQVDDLVLFFQDSSGGITNAQPAIVNKWLPYHIYTSPNLRASLDSVPVGWETIVFMEPKTKTNETYYFANLARLVAPSVPADGKPSRYTTGLPDATKYSPSQPAAGDLVIVPYDDPQSCYRVPQALYRACPTLDDKDIADIDFMAVQEGVLLANIPKVELTGISCYLLNLIGLRSATIGAGLNKTQHAREVSRTRTHRAAAVDPSKP
jgi:hypothetical protein